MEASTSRLGLCKGCSQAARYTCPACAFSSCSLACSKQHKVDSNCTGVAPPVWALPLQANQLGWGPLMRDQSYISGVGRKAEEVGRQLVGDKLIPTSRRVEEGASRLDEKTDREDKLVKDARNEGVELVLLPRGMSRRVRNGSRWDQKQNRLEWTTEVTFQPYPYLKPAPAPLTFTTTPQPSSSSLHTVLSSAMAVRDKKGKGKEVSEEEKKWVEVERKWLSAWKPDEEEQAEPSRSAKVQGEAGSSAETEAVAPAVEGSPTTTLVSTPPPAPPQKEDDISDAEDEETEPPFLLLLAVYKAPPSHTISSDTTLSSNPNLIVHGSTSTTSTSAPPPPASTSCKPPPRQFYLMHPSLPLRVALKNTTLLEYPSFELWSREAFLRARLMGKLEVIQKPRELPALVEEGPRGGNWERGRGRGRGRGGVGRGGRGGRGGGGSGGGREEQQPMERTADSGWGKRAVAAVFAEEVEGEDDGEAELEQPEEKRARLEVDEGAPELSETVMQELMGLGGLVGYESD